MSLIGIFYGSDTGNTEMVAIKLQEKLGGEDLVDVYDIAKTSELDFKKYDILLLGIPTWYYGESQADWEDFFPTLAKIDFTDKLVGIFGCGDQEDYAAYFCDAMGTIKDIIEPRGAIIVGHTSTEGFTFEASKALIDDKTFVGLCIDEDRQPELTEQRINNWVSQLNREMSLTEIMGEL